MESLITNNQWCVSCLDDAVNEVLELIHDIDDFNKHLEEVLELNDNNQLKRLNNWLIFFNEQATHLSGLYENLIHALLKLYLQPGLIHEQTTCQFEASKYFFSLFKLSRKSFAMIENDSALILFQISLIQASYPQLIRKSILKEIRKLPDFLTKLTVKRFFENIFQPVHKVPYLIISHLELLSYKEWLLVVDLLDGINIRRSEHLPMELSKRESQILRTKLPYSLSFSNEVVLRLVLIAKLMIGSKRFDRFYIENIITGGNTFYNNPKLIIKDIDFWKKAYLLLGNFKSDNYGITPVEALDYIEFKKYHSNEDFSLKGRTVKSITRAVLEWHEESHYENLLEYQNYEWDKKYQDTTLEIEGFNYSFEEINTGKRLLEESKEMKHCVFSYIEQCLSSDVSIFSMQKRVNDKVKNCLTIEVKRKEIVQIAGCRNRRPTKEEEIIINKWAKNLGLENTIH